MPPTRTPTRLAALGVAAAAASLALGGCGHLGANLARREVVVHFDPAAPQAQHDAARSACTGLPGASAEPRPTSTLPSVRAADVRFRVDSASDAQLAALYRCLARQPGVVGVDIPDASH